MQTCGFVGVVMGILLTVQVESLPGDPGQETEGERIARLIQQLGANTYARREAASRELAALGNALRALRQAAVSSADLEIRRRADRAFQAIANRLGLLQKAAEVQRIAWAGIHAYNTTFSPDGRHLLAGGDGGTLRLYEVPSGKLVRELVGHGGWTQHAVFTPDGKQALSASMDGTLRLWDLGTGQEVRRFEGHTGGVHSAALTRDGRWALSGGDDGALRLWEVATGKEVRKFTGHTSRCLGQFLPDGKQILSHSFDHTLRLWDVASGKEVRKFAGHTHLLFGAFLLPGGKQALSYAADSTARLWDLSTGKEVKQLLLGDRLSDIHGLALSPDGQRILVGNDGPPMVRLLELATGKELHRFALATNPRGLSFAPDGRLAASGSWRGLVYLWRMPGIFEVD